MDVLSTMTAISGVVVATGKAISLTKGFVDSVRNVFTDEFTCLDILLSTVRARVVFDWCD
jgi:DNA-binding protein